MTILYPLSKVQRDHLRADAEYHIRHGDLYVSVQPGQLLDLLDELESYEDGNHDD